MRLTALLCIPMLAVTATACGSPAASTTPSPTTTTTTRAPTTTTTTRAPTTTPPTTTTRAPATTAAITTSATTAATTTSVPDFTGALATIDRATAARMTASWRPGCPVELADLRLLTVDHWGFDGAVHRGELVVHADYAAAVVGVFQGMFEEHFPIERMELVDVYGGDDDLSTRANNTSAFNCRAVIGGTRWSEHAYGTAVDVNPVQNPYVTGGRVTDPAAARFTDRSLTEPGMIHPDDAVVTAFARIGWTWGGAWTEPKDYQHFSASGR